jgi:replicative DNA helicase
VHALGDVLLGEDDYDWVVEDLLERGDRLMLTGGEGAGKSALLRQISILSSAGIHPFSFFRQAPIKVLVVDAENTEKQWRRESRPIVSKAALHGNANPADVLQLWCAPRMDLTKDSHLSDVHQAMDDVKPDLLVIGPLYRLIPRAINSDDDAAPLLAALDTLRDRGVAMIIEAHAGHGLGGGGERDMRPRGSAALMGWPEFGLGLMVDRGGKSSNDFKLVRWRGDRDRRKWPARLSRGISEWPWTPTVEMR